MKLSLQDILKIRQANIIASPPPSAPIPAPIEENKPVVKRSLAEILEAKKATASSNLISSPAPNGEDKDFAAYAEVKIPADESLRTVHSKIEPKLTLADILKAKQLLDTTVPLNEEQKVILDKPAETFSLNIQLNERQLAAKNLALASKSFCLIGAAGTGKTTTQRAVAQTLLESNSLGLCSFKLPNSGRDRVEAPSIAFVSYTRRAARNLARAIFKLPALEERLQYNVMTIHALLEYEPETYWNAEESREAFRFVPRKTASNPLEITHLVIEEASMLGLDLWEKLYAAMLAGVQIIFIGDINQLPPVFGASILNYALVQLPVVELNKVYRQVDDSPVLNAAHNILEGKFPVEARTDKGSFTIVRGNSPVQLSQNKTALTLNNLFSQLYSKGEYDPTQDIILSPWNKAELGTDVLNNYIAQFIGDSKDEVVYEIIAGFNKKYLAVGDRIMFNKMDGVITKIQRNPSYAGIFPQTEGRDLTRFGIRKIGHPDNNHADKWDEDPSLTLDYSTFSVDALLEQEAERKQQASHRVTVELENGDIEVLSTAGEFSPQIFSLGYCLTVHKAQGCEWRKVYIVLHKEHAVSLTRELLYTAVTRASQDVVIIAKDEVIKKAISIQRIKGDTLADKIEYFNSGAIDNSNIKCTKP